MLSPSEQKTTIGERILRRSTTWPSDILMRPAARLLPIKSSSTMNWISSAFRLTCPPHQRSNSRYRSASVSTLEYTLYCLVHNVLDGFWFSKFCTSHAPSNLPPPTSPVSAVSQLPPSRPPEYRIGYLPWTPAQ